MYIDLIVTDKNEWAASSKYLQKCLPGAISIDMSGNLSIKPFFDLIKAYSRVMAPIRYLLINDHARLDSDVKNIAPNAMNAPAKIDSAKTRKGSLVLLLIPARSIRVAISLGE